MKGNNNGNWTRKKNDNIKLHEAMN